MILKLLSYNIRFGGEGRVDHLAQVIKTVAPDLVVLQEATNPDVIKRVSDATELPFWAARKDHSIGYLSRREVTYHEWHYPAGAKHSFLEIVPAESQSRIFGLHLSARFSKWDEQRRTREIRSLLKGIERHQGGFHVLVGDFNTLAPGEVLELWRLPAWLRALIFISGRKLQRETIQIMLDAGYKDAFRILHKDVRGYTFPTRDPHVRLDYVFIPAAYTDRLVSCDVVVQPPEAIKLASDHCPLLAEIEID